LRRERRRKEIKPFSPVILLQRDGEWLVPMCRLQLLIRESHPRNLFRLAFEMNSNLLPEWDWVRKEIGMIFGLHTLKKVW